MRQWYEKELERRMNEQSLPPSCKSKIFSLLAYSGIDGSMDIPLSQLQEQVSSGEIGVEDIDGALFNLTKR